MFPVVNVIKVLLRCDRDAFTDLCFLFTSLHLIDLQLVRLVLLHDDSQI